MITVNPLNPNLNISTPQNVSCIWQRTTMAVEIIFIATFPPTLDAAVVTTLGAGKARVHRVHTIILGKDSKII